MNRVDQAKYKNTSSAWDAVRYFRSYRHVLSWIAIAIVNEKLNLVDGNRKERTSLTV